MTATDDDTRPDESTDDESAPPPDAGPRASGRRLERLAALEEERRYLLASLRDLERERAAGDVDDEDYATLKDGYTVRAAAVLRQIESGRQALAPRPARNWKRTIATWVAVAVIAGGVGVALASAFGERSSGQEITGRTLDDDVRTVLAEARAALNRGDFVRANELFLDVDERERERGNDNVEALTYFGWTLALRVRAESAATGEMNPDLLAGALLALDQATQIEPTYADPYCFIAIIEFNFRGDADAALPFVEQCQDLGPPADVRGLVDSFADEIRAAATP